MLRSVVISTVAESFAGTLPAFVSAAALTTRSLNCLTIVGVAAAWTGAVKLHFALLLLVSGTAGAGELGPCVCEVCVRDVGIGVLALEHDDGAGDESFGGAGVGDGCS